MLPSLGQSPGCWRFPRCQGSGGLAPPPQPIRNQGRSRFSLDQRGEQKPWVVPLSDSGPNEGVQLTASSVRCAPASGSS